LADATGRHDFEIARFLPAAERREWEETDRVREELTARELASHVPLGGRNGPTRSWHTWPVARQTKPSNSVPQLCAAIRAAIRAARAKIGQL